MSAKKCQFSNFEFRSGRRGSKPISSTFVSKNDDSDFVAVESPINFNKRKLSEKQKEKMREKKQEQGHIPAMYSACDNSQSRSQYLEDTQVRIQIIYLLAVKIVEKFDFSNYSIVHIR